MRKLFASALVAVVIAASVAWAITVTTSTRSMQLTEETISSDADSTITLQGVEKAVTTAAAAGDTSPGVEAVITTFPSVNNAITEGNWVYKFQVAESGVASWPAARQYKVFVYKKTGTDWVLATTLYFQNATSDAVTTEGVVVKVDVGSASVVPDGFSVQLEKVQ